MIPKPIKINPKKATIGPTTMRRVLKISSLKPLASDEPDPNINKNPIIMAAAAMPINTKFAFTRGNCETVSVSIPARLFCVSNFSDMIVSFIYSNYLNISS